VSEVTCWFDDLADDYWRGQGLRPHHASWGGVVDRPMAVLMLTKGTPMQIVLGPVVARKGGYAFDCWTPEEGLSRGYTYGRIEDARYARNIEIRSRNNKRSLDQTIACSTVDEFVRLTI
jgi:hypothetical protein